MVPIAQYGLVGDTRTAALTSPAGSIDWMCAPRFDADPVFGALVGGDGAGRFAIDVDGVRHTRRRYRDRSAILETHWRTADADLVLTEGMAVDVSSALMPQALLVRKLECRRGTATVRVLFDPRPAFGARMRAERRHGALVCTRGGLALGLTVDHPDAQIEPGRVAAVTVGPSRNITLALSIATGGPLVLVDPDRGWDIVEAEDGWWREWTDRAHYEGPGRALVQRSLITLRLLTFSPSGAPVAAPTTSLPEVVGARRNWDYRYAWPRDASIGVEAFLAVGLQDEARAFMRWLLHTSRLSSPRLHPLYTLFGKPVPGEREIPGAPGYAGSAPVRVGNDAHGQHQLDVYGWVLDAAWRAEDAGLGTDAATWRALAAFARLTAKHWRDPDAGIWESRDEPRDHVFSKLMGWLALSRAIDMASRRGRHPRRVQRWSRARDELAAQVRELGFDERRGTYVAAYGSEDLDAALLLLPWIAFEDAASPRVAGTIDAIRRELGAGGPFVRRTHDTAEGAFLPCSFWLVHALASIGRADEASVMFEELSGVGGELGLFAEECDPSTRAFLGNYPQAFTHAALIQSGLALQEATASRTGRGASRTTRARSM